MGSLFIDTINILGVNGRQPQSITGTVGPDIAFSYDDANDKIIITGARFPLTDENAQITFVY
jgi:hypothetical protein